jgi:ribosomal protein S21
LIYVKVRKGQSIDKALSILKKKVKESKLMVELREREFYTKPSAIRKEKNSKARLRNKKDTNN